MRETKILMQKNKNKKKANKRKKEQERSHQWAHMNKGYSMGTPQVQTHNKNVYPKVKFFYGVPLKTKKA